MVIEAFAIGVNVWALWVKWNAPWWAFCAQAFSLAAVCGAATLAVAIMWRNRDIPRIWDELHDEG